MQRFFKLETYVGKLLMSYLNKYVKLREDQFAMSIWDGDLILTQLDLRLDFLEDIIPFPVNFRSGRVHELRIHVPWTKLNSECIVISLHTVECIFGLKKRDVKKTNQNNQLPANFADICTYKSQQMPTNVPPGYLEIYIHRLLSNIHFVVHNLNLKFIEEDIVLSVSVNKADSFVTDSNGNPIFADINPCSTYAIHRVVQFFDLTVCLDRAGPNGYVEVYEDPIAYRFSMSCFLQVVCIPNAKSSSLINQTVLTNLKIHCQTFVAHISPAQIPLLCRLIQVLLSVSTETFDWSILDSCSHDNTKSETGSSDNSCTQIGELNNETDKSDTETQSWASWVWSFVPTILPMNEDSDESDSESIDSYTKEPQLDTECFKQLIQCILEDTYEQEVAAQLSVHDPSYDEALSPSNTHNTPHLSHSRSSEELGDNTSQLKIHRPSKEEYSQTRRRKIRRLRRSASMVPVFIIGIYFDKFDLNISLPSPRGFSCPSSNSGIRSRRSKRQFHHSVPAIKFELTDIAFQITLRDVYFHLVQLGIRGFHCYPVGCVCCCGQSEYANNSQRDTVHISTVDSLSSGSTNASKCPVSKACTYDDNPDRIPPNFISLGCYPINSNSSSSPSSSSSESCFHPREIFYSAVSSQQQSYSGSDDNTLPTNYKLSGYHYSPILTLNDYNKHLKDKDLRQHYPAIWFDSVCSLSLDDSHITPSDIPSVRQHQVNGVREYIYNRCLLGSYSVEVSPSLIHRLAGLVNAYKISHPYPPCSITKEDINTVSTPNEISLSRYSQHIPMCNIQLDISTGTVSVNTSHNFNRNHLSPQLQIHLENISLFNRSPVYPFDIVHIIRRLNIPPYLLKRSYEFIQMELCNPMKRVDDWLQDIHSDVLNMSNNNKEWNKQLIAYCYNRTIIQVTGISVDLVRHPHVNQSSTSTITTATTANKSNDNVTIFKLSSLECMFWSLNCPQLWSSPSLSHLEYRLTLANIMEMYFTLQTIHYLSYILSELFHQIFHLKAYCYSEDTQLSLPPVYEYQPENDSHSAVKTSWIWCTKIHGISRFRLCLTKFVSILQISLETNLLMYLNCLNEKGKMMSICPILERSSGDKSTEHKTSMKPLFCLAVQIPYSHDLSSTAPIICHAYLNKIDCLITRELFEWFSYLTPPNTNCEMHSYHECNQYVNNSVGESFIGMKTSDFTKKKHQFSSRSQSGSDISSKELIKANIIASSFSAYSVISPAYSFAIGNMAQWKEVWKRLVYCEKILQNAKIQILTKPLKIYTLVCQCPTTFSAFADSINHQYLEELLKQFEDNSMLFNFPQLYASNYNWNTEDQTNKEQDPDDAVLSNCLWSCGLFELPTLKQESNITTPPPPQSTTIHWSISASQAYLLVENSLIFAGQASISLDLNRKKVDDLCLVNNDDDTLATSNQMMHDDKTNSVAINVQVNIELDNSRQSSYLSNENYRRGVDFKVLNHMVNVVRFCYDNLSSIVIPKLLDFSTTVYKNTTSTRLLSRTSYSRNSNPSSNIKLLPITAHSPPYTSSLNSISILEESSTDVPTIVYKSLLTSPHGKLKTTRTTMVESPQMTSCYSTKLNYSQNEELSTSSLPPFSITLHVECSLSSVSGEIHLSHSSLMNSDEQPVSLHWSVDNVQLILEIQKECCSIDFHVGSCSAFIQKSTEMRIPLFTLLEKDIQPLHLLQPYINLTCNSNNEDSGIHSKVQSNDYAKSSWFEENYIPLIPLNARKRHWLNSTRNRHEDKSNIGHYFLRIVMTRSCSKFNSTSDYYSASQSDLSVMLDNTSCRVNTMLHPENHVNISVQPLDIVIIPEVLDEISEFINNCLDYKGSLVDVVGGDSSSPESYSVKKDDICMESVLSVNSLPVINATIDSFRMFYVLSGLSENNHSVKYPNALMLSCDFIQVKPLVENFIERPVWCISDDTHLSVKQQHQQSFAASKPIVVIPCDKQISILANCINILAVPFKFMCNVKPENDYNSSVSNAIAQNPAKDWNRVASYSDIDDPLYGWSVVHSFDISVIFAPAYGKYENSESYIYGGYSMEFSIMNDLLILADCDLISYLVQLIPPITSNCHTQKSSSSSSPPITRKTLQQSLLPSLFEKLLFSNNNDCLLSTPSRLFITTRQINFLMWKSTSQGDVSGKDALAVFTSQISQPHIILNFAGTGNYNASDHFEFSINGLQVDCRLGQLKSPCSQCKPIVINKFSEKKSQKEPYIIFFPCEIDIKVLTSSMDRVMNPLQLCSSLIFWHSDKRIVNSRTGISQPCLSITFQRPSRSDHLSAVVNPVSSKHNCNRFNVCFKVGQDQTLCIRPDTLSAVLYFCKFFHELFEVNSCLSANEINRCRNNTDLLTSSIRSSSPSSSPSSSSTARFIHLLHPYLEKINIETNSIRINLQFDERNNKGIDFRVLEFKLKHLSTVIQLINSTNSGDTLTTSIEYLSNLSGLSLSCRSARSNSLIFTKISNPRKPVYLIWPNTCLTVGGSINTNQYCMHNLNDEYSVYSFDKVTSQIQLNCSLLIHLPVYGYINDYIKLILMKITHIVKSIQICNKLLCFKSSTVQCFNKNDSSCCIHCSSTDNCVVIHSDDLRRNFTLSQSSSISSSSQFMLIKPDDVDPVHHQSHPCYPWVLNQQLWEQSPLQRHRWPLQNEIVCCNNLLNNFTANEDNDDKDVVEDEEKEEERLRNPQWLGITWMHPEVCRPNYLRILPIPFELVSSKLNNVSDEYSLNGFELQCYLQYWDPFHQYNGSFLTYSSFILSDSQINEYDLSKVNSFNQYGVVPSTVQTYQQGSNCQNNANISNCYVEKKEKMKDSVDYSSDSLSFNLHFSDDNASAPTDNTSYQPVSVIWRILVDLRIRPGSGIINPSINENHPIALADLTPMVLIGAIDMNTVHYPNNCHHPLENSLIVRCQIPNITVSLVEHIQSEHDNIGGFELSRFCVDKVDFLYLSNVSSLMSLNRPSNDNIHLRVDKHTVLTADVSWARLQQSIVGESFSCHLLCNQNMNILHRSLSIFISSDRLISIGLLKQRLQKYTKEYLSILESMYRSRNEMNSSDCNSFISSNDHSPLGWTIVNHTNQSIILDQLPLIKYSSDGDSTPTISNSEIFNPVNSLFDISVKPRECVNWRPIVFPGPVSPAGHAFRIKLRIGIHSTGIKKNNKTLIWTHPIDLPWPLLIRQQNSDILCALSLKWEETTKFNSKDDNEDEKDDDVGIYYPEIYLIVCSPEPIGSPGKIILHSNVILRNLLPVQLTCTLNTSTTATTTTNNNIILVDKSKKSNQNEIIHRNTVSPTQFINISTCPASTEFISTYTNNNSGHKAVSCNLHMAFKVNSILSSKDELKQNEFWSEQLIFKMPTAGQLNSQTETSLRTCIQLFYQDEINCLTNLFSFYAILTVEYYAVSFITPPICMITISPLLEIMNCMPIPLKLESKAISPQQTINSNSLTHEMIPPAAFYHPRNSEDSTSALHDCYASNRFSRYPYTLAKPIRLVYHYDLLLTGTLPDGEPIFSHPIRLSGQEILKKLATTYLNCTVNSNATASSSSNENLISKSIQPSTSLPVISTLGLIPKLYCMHNDYLNNLHSSSYSSSSSSYKMKLNESSNLQYSLRLVLNSQLLLINRTGIDLHLKLPSMKSDMPSSSTSPSSAAATAATTIKRVISLKDKESVALAQNQHYFQLGITYNNKEYWSEIISIQLPMDQSGLLNNKVEYSLSSFVWNNKLKTLSLPNMPTTYINLLIDNRILCLLISIQYNNYNMNEENKFNEINTHTTNINTTTNNFIVTIEPRFHINPIFANDEEYNLNSLCIRPIVIPLGEELQQQETTTKVNSSLSSTPISASQLNEEFASEIVCNSTSTPLLWWTLSRDIDRSLSNIELLYCMQISIKSTVLVQPAWSHVFPLHRIPKFPYNTSNLSEQSSIPIYLCQVTIPVSLKDNSLNNFTFCPTLLISTMEYVLTNQIVIHINKTSILQTLNPFSIHLLNNTHSSVYSVELLDELSFSKVSSSSPGRPRKSDTKLFSDSMSTILKASFIDTDLRYKCQPNSQISIMPQSLIDLLYIDTVNRNNNNNNSNNSSAENLSLNFFDPSHFKSLELKLYLKEENNASDTGRCCCCCSSSSLKDPISINLKDFYSSSSSSSSSVDSAALWQTRKHINDQLSIHLYYSLNNSSFGLIVQLFDNSANKKNTLITNPTLSSTSSSILPTSFKYFNKINLIINKVCLHLLTIENRILNQKNNHKNKKKNSTSTSPMSSLSSSSSTLSTSSAFVGIKHGFYEILPPHDEFLRFTLVNLCTTVLLMSEDSRLTNHSILPGDDKHQYILVNKQYSFEISLQHFQADNWCHAWTNMYDFPVILQTVKLKRPKIICQFNLALNKQQCLSSFISTSSPSVITLFFYPPNLDVYLEDSLIYDFLELFNNFLYIFDRYYNLSCPLNIDQMPLLGGVSNISLPPKIINESSVLMKQLVIDAFRINLSLRAMFRLYLSCHSAPLNFTAFKLVNITDVNQSGNSTNVQGSLVYWSSLKYLLTVHYITQMLFRSGWLVGSLDLLGNVTGLLYSLVNGLNDLIHLRSSEMKSDEDENKIGMITLSNPSGFVSQESAISPTTTITTMTGVNISLKSNQNIGFLYRLYQGFSSLTRRTTGGLLLSISGMASSLARNLDYLSLDPHYEQHQDQIRRHRTPKGFGEGIQLGLSSFGLCLLSAIAGIADQPLQAIFKTIDNHQPNNSESCSSSSSPSSSLDIFNSLDVDQSRNYNFLLSTLGGFGRGLVGVVTKPAAGAAELIAQTSKGLLHGTSNSIEITIPSKYGDPYTSSEIGLRLHYQNVDCMIICHWSSLALQCTQRDITSSSATAALNISKEDSLISGWFTSAIYNHDTHEMVTWLSASLDQHLVCTSINEGEGDSPHFSWFKTFPDRVLNNFVNKLIPLTYKHLNVTEYSTIANNSMLKTSMPSNPLTITSLSTSLPFISPTDSCKWIEHIQQFNSSNDLHCLTSIIENFWLTEEDKMKESTSGKQHMDAKCNSSENLPCINDDSFDSNRSDIHSSDILVCDDQQRSSRWKRVREYLMGISPSDLIHI